MKKFDIKMSKHDILVEVGMAAVTVVFNTCASVSQEILNEKSVKVVKKMMVK